MTLEEIKAKAADKEWAAEFTGSMARYTFTTKRYFLPYQYIEL